MKYLVIVIISVFAGFVGAWLLFDATVPDPPIPTTDARTAISAPPVVIYKPVESHVTFRNIQDEPHVFNQLLMSWQLAAQSDVAEIETLVDTCLELDDPLFTEVVTSILIEKYIAIDPVAAYDFVRNEHRFNQEQMLAHVFTSWIRYDAETALVAFEGVTDQQARLAIGSRLLADAALHTPGLSARIEELLGPLAQQINQRLTLQRSDPEELFESALGQAGQLRRSSLATAIRRWMSSDPRAALARITLMNNDADRMFAAQFAIQNYVQTDPEAALTWLRDNFPGNTQLEAQALANLAHRNVERALPLVEDFYRRTGDTQAVHNLVTAWSSKDPIRALAYVERFDTPQKPNLYQAIAHGYLEQRPEEALNWLLSLGPEYQQVKVSALSNLAYNNQALAEQALTRVSDSDIRTSLMQGIVSQRARYDPDGALDWLQDYEDDPGYSGALSSVLWQMAQHNPERAAELIGPSITEDTGLNYVRPVFQSWYQRNPDAALAWISSLEAGVIRQRATSQAIAVVARTDIDAALELLATLPEGNDATNAKFQIANAWVAREPDRLEYIIEELELTDELAANLRQRSSGFTIYR